MTALALQYWPVLAAYLLGGILGGRIIGRLRGVDLRAAGSGNIGATNALRTQGKAFALAVLAIDMAKGAVAVLLLPQYSSLAAGSPEVAALPYLCGAAATVGHCFPPWHGFDGGKGVATLSGAFLALLPATFAWMLLVFVLAILLFGMASLATLAAATTGLLLVLWHTAALAHPASLFALAMLLLVLFTHRQNWQRLLAGTESRFERARLLGKLLHLP